MLTEIATTELTLESVESSSRCYILVILIIYIFFKVSEQYATLT